MQRDATEISSPHTVGNDYKSAHEAFVSGLQGGSLGELIILLALLPTTLLLQRIILTTVYSNSHIKFNNNNIKQQQKQQQGGGGLGWIQFGVEFVCGVVPLLLAFTILSDYVVYIVVSLLLVCAILITFSQLWFNMQLVVWNTPDQATSLSGPYKPFLTEYRAALIVSTFIAILAVDFPVFPRRFAKTETFGHSLMDIGVGAFVLASALTSKQARDTANQSHVVSKFLPACKSAFPLFVIGVSRLFSVRATNYQEHISEYGVHWNFFFTLAMIPILLSILNIPVQYQGVGGISVMIVYQIFLSFFGGADYIQNDYRGDLFSQNKEGIFSVVGFTCLFMFGTQLGRFLSYSRATTAQWRNVVKQLWTLDIILWIVVTISDTLIVAPSRRMANWTYVVCVVALSVFNIAGTLSIYLFTNPVPSIIAESINYNGLAMFLLANIMTGLVNMTIRTLYTPNIVAVWILGGYMLGVCSVSLLCYRQKIHLKFW